MLSRKIEAANYAHITSTKMVKFSRSKNVYLQNK